jgi:hypothetical protein
MCYIIRHNIPADRLFLSSSALAFLECGSVRFFNMLVFFLSSVNIRFSFSCWMSSACFTNKRNTPPGVLRRELFCIKQAVTDIRTIILVYRRKDRHDDSNSRWRSAMHPSLTWCYHQKTSVISSYKRPKSSGYCKFKLLSSIPKTACYNHIHTFVVNVTYIKEVNICTKYVLNVQDTWQHSSTYKTVFPSGNQPKKSVLKDSNYVAY